jgi:hypothetical protein
VLDFKKYKRESESDKSSQEIRWKENDIIRERKEYYARKQKEYNEMTLPLAYLPKTPTEDPVTKILRKHLPDDTITEVSNDFSMNKNKPRDHESGFYNSYNRSSNQAVPSKSLVYNSSAQSTQPPQSQNAGNGNEADAHAARSSRQSMEQLPQIKEIDEHGADYDLSGKAMTPFQEVRPKTPVKQVKQAFTMTEPIIFSRPADFWQPISSQDHKRDLEESKSKHIEEIANQSNIRSSNKGSLPASKASDQKQSSQNQNSFFSPFHTGPDQELQVNSVNSSSSYSPNNNHFRKSVPEPRQTTLFETFTSNPSKNSNELPLSSSSQNKLKMLMRNSEEEESRKVVFGTSSRSGLHPQAQIEAEVPAQKEAFHSVSKTSRSREAMNSQSRSPNLLKSSPKPSREEQKDVIVISDSPFRQFDEFVEPLPDKKPDILDRIKIKAKEYGELQESSKFSTVSNLVTRLKQLDTSINEMNNLLDSPYFKAATHLLSEPGPSPSLALMTISEVVWIKEIWAKGELRIKQGHSEELAVKHDFILEPLSWKNISTLQNTRWLNDEVVNAYLRLLDYVLEGQKGGKRRVVNSFFYPMVIGKGAEKSKILRLLSKRKIDVKTIDQLYIPVNVSNTHWCFLIIDFAALSVIFCDSLKKKSFPTNEEYILEFANTLLKERGGLASSQLFTSIKVNRDFPVQNNHYDCGVFMLKGIDLISRIDRPAFDQTDALYLRHLICFELLNGKLSETN